MFITKYIGSFFQRDAKKNKNAPFGFFTSPQERVISKLGKRPHYMTMSTFLVPSIVTVTQKKITSLKNLHLFQLKRTLKIAGNSNNLKISELSFQDSKMISGETVKKVHFVFSGHTKELQKDASCLTSYLQALLLLDSYQVRNVVMKSLEPNIVVESITQLHQLPNHLQPQIQSKKVANVADILTKLSKLLEGSGMASLMIPTGIHGLFYSTQPMYV